MKYLAKTTLKRKDTDGGVPSATLDQYVRNELTQTLLNVLKPHLSVQRHEYSEESALQAHLARVDFTTELVMLQPAQWTKVKEWLNTADISLPSDQQIALQQLIADVERS